MIRLSKIDETHWGGMVKRSSGKIVRKEDELDGLTFEEFFQRMREKYEVVEDRYESMFKLWGWSSFTIPFCNIGNGRRMSMTIKELGTGEVENVMMDDDIFKRYIGVEGLDEGENVMFNNGLAFIHRTRGMKFSECSRLIDRIIDRIPEPLVRRK